MSSRGERNNNSGNIEDGPWARSQPGYAGTDGRFAKFNSPNAGNDAQVRLIRDGKRYRGQSPAGVVQVYAPLGDNSEASIRNYIGYAAARAGIDPDKPIPADKYHAFAQGMREFETGKTVRGTRFSPYGGQLRGGGNRGGGGSAPSQAGMIQMPSVPNVRDTKATPGESARSAKPRDYAIIDPADATTRGRSAARGARTATDDYLDSVSAALDTNRTRQDEELAALQTRNAARAGVREQIVTGTKSLIESSTPIFQKKRAIADRIGEIADMSPLERMIRGTFDPNYNETSLNARDRRYGAQLNSMAEEYEYTSKLQNVLMSQINDEYQSGQDVFTLLRQNTMQDLQLMGMSVGANQGVLAQVMDEIRADNTIESSKNFAITDTVSKMSLGQLNEAETGAVDGMAIVNGLEIPVQMIADRLDVIQNQDYDMASREMSLQSQNMALAEQSENRIVGRMTDAEVNAAIQNNGQHGGQTFAMDKLLAHQSTLAAGRQNQAQQAQLESAPSAAASMWRGLAQQNTNLASRITSLGGGNDQGFIAISGQIAGAAQLFSQGAKKAREGGYLDEFTASELPKIQQLYDNQEKYVQAYAKRWGGGDKSMEALGTAWLTGQPLNNRESAKALLTMARDGLPQGTRLTGAPRRAYDVAVAAYRESQTAQPNTPSTAMFGSPKKASGFTDELIDSVMDRVRKSYTGAVVNDVIQSAPSLARNVRGRDGKIHPYSQVRPQDHAAAVQLGDAEGANQVGMDLGFKSGDEFMRVFNSEAAWNRWAQGRTVPSRSEIGKQLTLAQTQSTFKHLDASPSARNGFKPSAAYADLMGNPDFQRVATQAAGLQRQQSPGAYAVGFASGEGSGQGIVEYANMVPRAFQSAHARRIANTTAQAQEYMGNPIKRAEVILSGTSLSPREQRTLLAGVQNHVDYHKGDVMEQLDRANSFLSFGNHSSPASTQFDDVVMNGKFDDPKLESLRRRAAGEWQQIAPKATSMIQRIFGD